MQLQKKNGINILSEDDILDIIQIILTLKQQLHQINFLNNNEEQFQKETKYIQIKQRFKTHHNLGAIKQKKLSLYEQNFKITSECDEITQNQSNEYKQELIQISPQKPWHSIIINSRKNSQMEFLSEQQIKSENYKSLASVTSNASCQDLGIITLREELQTVYSYELKQEDNQDSCTQNSNDIIQSNLNDSIYDYKNKRSFEIIGFIVMTIGVAGWMYQKSK